MRRGICLLVVAFGCLIAVPTVEAAPPANDDFGAAQDLGSGLPVAAAGTNLEATKETGEPSPDPFAATGHSVWYEWEATSSGFVTLSTCDSGLRYPILAVYTGTAIGALTEVAGDFPSKGPDCPAFGAAVTFKATGGIAYKIQVDSSIGFLEPGPNGQGTIALELDATPVPANDDFADATVLVGQVREDNGIYTADATGYTWNAGKEPGEPDHAGNPGGASVWYSWTAPKSTTYGVAGCGRIETLPAVYSGDSLGNLTEVAFGNQSCLVAFPATAGTTYRIAIDGVADAGSGAAMGAVWVNVWEGSPPGDPEQTESAASSAFARPADAPGPDTTIRKRKVKPALRSVLFAFHSSQGGSTFRCRLDERPFVPCASPSSYRNLKRGRHKFEVFAVDAAGRQDPTPAVARFRIPQPKLPKAKR